MKIVIKRDGRIVTFDKNKIRTAILSAMKRTDTIDESLANYIVEQISHIGESSSVEEIQDKVENLLMGSNRKDVAKEYILYRADRTKERERDTLFMKQIAEKIHATDVKNQNANLDERSFGGRRGEADSVLMKRYALDYCMSKASKAHHENNEIYIHDLDAYAVGMHNCLSIPFDDLLAKGFNTRQTDVRPANSINTAFQLLAVIFQIQSLQQFGGCSATHLDWTMVPYVRKSFYKHFTDGLSYIVQCNIEEEPSLKGVTGETPIDDAAYKQKEFAREYNYARDMTIKELRQAVEGMYHNLNTLQSRSGCQLPFTSINYGTCTSVEGRMVIRALLQGSINGVGKHHRTPIFPCSIFQCMSGVNRKPGDPNYDLFQLALTSTAKRLYPNYANVDWSGNAGYDKNDPRTYFSTMGCRTSNGFDVNGLGYLKDGRGNICPVTIILPTIAMQAKERFEEEIEEHDLVRCDENIEHIFMDMLKDYINEAKNMLIERFEYVCSQPPDAAKFMYENGTMAGYVPKEGIRSALKHGTLAIGQIGMAETLQILANTNQLTDKGMEIAKHIEQLFQRICAEFKERYKLNFGVYYTPAENLSYTAMQKFRERYGKIPNVSDHEYFTNSIHVPVWEKVSVYKKIQTEAQLTGYSSAGCITYIELDGGAKENILALESFVNYAMDSDIPYFAINVPCDTCLDCGYSDEFDDHCPECGSTHIQQLRRVTGYLTGDYKTAFNKGKQAEVQEREKHTKYTTL